jgi:hypothetical protein
MHDHLQFLIRGFALIYETVRDWEGKADAGLGRGPNVTTEHYDNIGSVHLELLKADEPRGPEAAMWLEI